VEQRKREDFSLTTPRTSDRNECLLNGRAGDQDRGEKRFNNHAFATAQSRSTVAVETSRAAAVSSMLSPAKNLSSTTRHDRVLQTSDRDSATTFVGPSSARMIHKDLAHQSCGERAEVRTTVDSHPFQIHEVQVSFMDERCRLQ
jgi:hypothetical protein